VGAMQALTADDAPTITVTSLVTPQPDEKQ
jgi:hypothetical protein